MRALQAEAVHDKPLGARPPTASLQCRLSAQAVRLGATRALAEREAPAAPPAAGCSACSRGTAAQVDRGGVAEGTAATDLEERTRTCVSAPHDERRPRCLRASAGWASIQSRLCQRPRCGSSTLFV